MISYMSLIHHQPLTWIFEKIQDILEKRAKILEKIWANLAKNGNFQIFERHAPVHHDSASESKISYDSNHPSLRTVSFVAIDLQDDDLN